MLNIKTHKMRYTYMQPHFYILSKGNNSGKPMEKACPNCFVCLCKSEEEKHRLYWLFYGLWQGMFFHPFITGSVIPFIRLDDLKRVAKESLAKIELNPQQFTKNIEAMQTLNQHGEAITKQIKLIKQAKKALMYQVLK
ncbi:MAG: hypothetical protein KA163_07200 [Bacteroidia bacterium]|nr:hypothetical protein [Bacteroidia bacterium]